MALFKKQIQEKEKAMFYNITKTPFRVEKAMFYNMTKTPFRVDVNRNNNKEENERLLVSCMYSQTKMDKRPFLNHNILEFTIE